jgi:uncharacterized spore protein YtfJ
MTDRKGAEIMSDTPAVDILDALMRNMRDIISTKTIVGEPIVNNGITILPLMKVALGFGAGAGSGPSGKGTGNGGGAAPGGGGGGGGISITPVGFLVVDQNRAMMITPKPSKWDTVIEAVPDLVERLTRIVRKKGDSSAESPETGDAGSGE